jgi:hypothetical protein
MEKTETGLKYLVLSLSAFAGIMLEGLNFYILGPMIFKAPYGKWTTLQNISHWTLTAFIWVAVGLILVAIAKKKWQFDITESGGKMRIGQYITVALCILFCVAIKNLDGIKVLGELRYHGWFKYIFQMLYYLAEVALFMLIIVFAQKAGDLWFKKANIPWGGIICALTWGLIHIFTKNWMVGLIGAVLGILFGVVHLAVNRDIKKAYAAMFVMFVF